MCIGLVVTPDGGLPIGYEVFDGNRADVTSVEEIVTMMEKSTAKPNASGSWIAEW